MNQQEIMDSRLWDYIDAQGTKQELQEVAVLIAREAAWKERHEQLLQMHQVLSHMETSHPSKRL